MSSEPDRLVAERHRVLQIICGAILASQAIYVAVAWMVTAEGAHAPGAGGRVPPAVAMALVGVAVTCLASAEGVARLLQRRAKAAAAPETRAQGFLQATIVGFALREAAGIIGLVLSLLTGKLLWVVALGACAALAMAVAWPRRAQLAAVAFPDRPPAIG